MALLANDTGALRLRLELVQRERAAPGRVLASAALEHLDRGDLEHWPLVRLPPLWLAPGLAEALADGVDALVRGDAPGFSWQAGEGGPLGLQVSRTPGAPGGLQVEFGADLARFLEEVAGPAARPGAELALFRFGTTQAALVVFGASLRTELGALG
jgi:hypothetical protein